jgi:hypothetical protein
VQRASGHGASYAPDGGSVQRGEVIDEVQLDASFSDGLVVADPSVEEWIVRRVPVLAPAQRPMRRMPGGRDVPEPVGFAYVAFLNVNKRAQRLHELKAPEMIVALLRAKAQEAPRRQPPDQEAVVHRLRRSRSATGAGRTARRPTNRCVPPRRSRWRPRASTARPPAHDRHPSAPAPRREPLLAAPLPRHH